MPSQDITTGLHQTLAHEIKSAKKLMFRRHREGMSLRAASDRFCVDMAARFHGLVSEREPSSEVSNQREGKISDEQIATLAETICRSGDEPERKSEALLVLMHEITRERHPRGVDIASVASRVAFGRCGDEAIDAKANLLRTTMLTT